MQSLPRSRDFLTALAKLLGEREGLREPISDYRMAKILGVSRAMMSEYRTNKQRLSSLMCLKVAELLGEDPQYVLACIQAERAQNAAVRKAWEKIAGSAACAVLALALSLFPASPARAGSAATEIYILRTRRWWRSGKRLSLVAA